jgi:hypothetical protein
MSEPIRPGPVLYEYECGCIGLAPDAHQWAVVIRRCDGVPGASWRHCLHGLKSVLTSEESQGWWRRVAYDSEKINDKARAAEVILDALDNVRLAGQP